MFLSEKLFISLSLIFSCFFVLLYFSKFESSLTVRLKDITVFLMIADVVERELKEVFKDNCKNYKCTNANKDIA